MVFLHNHGSLIPNLSRVYGSDFAALFMNENDEFLSYFYEVSRVNLTELNTETNSCTKELDDIGGDPGLVLGKNGPKTTFTTLEWVHRSSSILNLESIK